MKADARLKYLSIFGLAIAVFAAFSGTWNNQFVTVDDPDYLLKNAHVSGGFSWSGIVWAFTQGYACNWHPITWLSHMLDCQVFGLNPSGHHLVSLLLHVSNTLLVFILLRQLTGAHWRSLLVAAFFGLHPLRAESVAWAAERKDVLSGLFGLLSLICYVAYRKARRQASQTVTPEIVSPKAKHVRSWYRWTLICLCLGLMSKPMLVTIPCVFLLLDLWEYSQVASRTHRSCWFKRLKAADLKEKVPFFALALVVSIITFLAQKQGGAVSSTKGLPMFPRIENALLAYSNYLGKTFWPSHLSPIYPLSSHISYGIFLGTIFIVGGISWLACKTRKSIPCIITGWLWFAVMLAPTIGIIQVGPQAMADRYTYLPSIGLFFALVWGLHHLLETVPVRRSVLFAGAGAALSACFVGATAQVRLWHDPVSLYAHALEIAPGNYIACDYLGNALHSQGRNKDAFYFLNKSVAMESRFPESQYNLGTLLAEQGAWSDAADHLRIAASLAPADLNIQINLGNVLSKLGLSQEALKSYQIANKLNPGDLPVHQALADTLRLCGRYPESLDHYKTLRRLAPNDSNLEHGFGLALAQSGRGSEAIPHFKRSVELSPADPDKYFDYGLVLLENHFPAQAANQFRKSLLLRENVWAHFRLGLADQEMERPAEALIQFQEVVRQIPNCAEAWDRIAALLLASPETGLFDAEEPLRYARRACEITKFERPEFLITLAEAYVHSERFREARTTAQSALKLARSENDTARQNKAVQLIELADLSDFQDVEF